MKEVWVSGCRGPRGGNLLASHSEGGGEQGERFVYKWGLEVGEKDGLSLHTTEIERERSVFD